MNVTIITYRENMLALSYEILLFMQIWHVSLAAQLMLSFGCFNDLAHVFFGWPCFDTHSLGLRFSRQVLSSLDLATRGSEASVFPHFLLSMSVNPSIPLYRHVSLYCWAYSRKFLQRA